MLVQKNCMISSWQQPMIMMCIAWRHKCLKTREWQYIYTHIGFILSLVCLTALDSHICAVGAACDTARWTGGTEVKTAVWVESTTEILQPDGLWNTPRSAEKEKFHFKHSLGLQNWQHIRYKWANSLILHWQQRMLLCSCPLSDIHIHLSSAFDGPGLLLLMHAVRSNKNPSEELETRPSSTVNNLY